jgi:RNA polymerase sigma-70 factor (ECF subfamily)
MATTVNYDLGLGVLEHTASLRRYAHFLTRTSDQADDLVQDCVTRALSRSHLYRPDTNLRAWLFTIMRNIFITQSRKAAHRRNYANECMAMSSDTTAPNQFHAVALKESLKLVEALPSRERQAILLLGVFEMTYIEAAQHSGIKVGTMKSRASRGRAHLRLLSQPGNHPDAGVAEDGVALETDASPRPFPWLGAEAGADGNDRARRSAAAGQRA